MLTLPFGCSCSEPTIFPKIRNRDSLRKSWYIQYYFRDPAHADRYRYGKLCIVKSGVNRKTSLAEREFAIQKRKEIEIQKLKAGHNPITGKKAAVATGDINAQTPLCEALELAYQRLEGVKGTKDGARIVLNFVQPALDVLFYAYIPVAEVEPKHIKLVLDYLQDRDGFSAAKYNRCRANLMMLFKVLKKNFVIKHNPATEIERKQTVKKIRAVLTAEERKKVNKILKKYTPEFYRYTHIFYHSGARKTELMQVKGKDVNLKAQTFKCIVRKRRGGPVEVEKLIKDIALPLWKEAMKGCGPEDFVFSKGLRPGQVAISPTQINRRWNRWIKKKTEITKDFYPIKHLHTTEISEVLGEKEAAKHNSHTTTAMVRTIYDVENENRKQKTIKSINNPL